MKRTPARLLTLILALAVACGLANPADAADDDIAAASEAIAGVMVPIGVARGLVAACAQRDPEGVRDRERTYRNWRRRNGVEGFEAAIIAVQAKAPELAAGRARLEQASAAQAESVVGRDPAACRQLPQVLGSREFQIARVTANAEGVLRALAGPPLPERKPSPAAPPPAPNGPAARPAPSAAPGPWVAPDPAGRGRARSGRPTTQHGVGQLSALARRSMDAARRDLQAAHHPASLARRERAVREEAAGKALAALGPIAVRGRVVDGRRLREWRDDRHSTFQIACTFAGREERARFEGERGRDAVVVGRVRHVAEAGTIGLDDCRVETAAAALPPATVPDEGGFEPRPPSREEAFAGPDRGIPPGEIERIVYKAAPETRTDGSGDGYLRRDEDTYLLLRDGTAYHHRWPFPPGDLDVALVRAREPERWFRWQAAGDRVLLTRTAGPEAGTTLVVAGFDTLLPLPDGTRIGRDYHVLQAGMGGGRPDRTYALRTDGTAGFAHAGGSDGARGLPVSHGRGERTAGRYRIAGHLLELTADDGTVERHFVARLASDRAGPPDSLYLGGQVLSTRKPKG
ncbi:hypothetical protein STVA_03830 [Allostella vacuolata]|nr:hypothetical protein STVA_03830 [Stella vacuolata]